MLAMLHHTDTKIKCPSLTWMEFVQKRSRRVAAKRYCTWEIWQWLPLQYAAHKTRGVFHHCNFQIYVQPCLSSLVLVRDAGSNLHLRHNVTISLGVTDVVQRHTKKTCWAHDTVTFKTNTLLHFRTQEPHYVMRASNDTSQHSCVTELTQLTCSQRVKATDHRWIKVYN